ncbi:hypothetical protein HAX54_014985 [Datura stramonium]|uniref:Uncharacterized protein n=1 Tax=Datura stramonium TaxID=4076 RepID=A0ABS8TNY7_DATST|nr:hypothetical protein [Datura stramonium]
MACHLGRQSYPVAIIFYSTVMPSLTAYHVVDGPLIWLSYGANVAAMALSTKVPSFLANNFIYFLCLSALLTNFAKFSGANAYCKVYGAADDILVDSTPRVTAVSLEVDGVDVESRHENDKDVENFVVWALISSTIITPMFNDNPDIKLATKTTLPSSKILYPPVENNRSLTTAHQNFAVNVKVD